jgi:transposase InsO family protein/transposase-like protein
MNQHEIRAMESNSTAEGAGGAAAAAPPEPSLQGALAPGQRWSLRRKRDVALRLVRGEPIAKLSRELGVEIYRLEQWREQAVAGIEASLRDRAPADPAQRELDAAKRHIGELSMEIASTGRRYGIQRVCRVWDKPRSSVYARRQRQSAPVELSRKRGPQPQLSDAELLPAIERDLGRSPWKGEGHRKVFARLRILDGIRVSRTRVLRVMREHRLLSPHRGRCAPVHLHEGTITTNAPNLMWGTDGVRVLTVLDGWVWIFSAVEHWNAECVGWHVCKVGNRFAALQPISMGLEALYGSVAAQVARGLALRMDHGTQYQSDPFVGQIRFWGIAPSFAFVEQPQTNGVAERFNRTLKEQVVHGRVFHNLDELRAAVADFVERYNHECRLQKLGFQTPCEARERHYLRDAA